MTKAIEILNDRAVITLSGPDRKKLLQGIITNNINLLSDGRGIYSALLTPQGKFLHDFFLFEKESVIYLDCEKPGLEDLFNKLLMYRLRSNVEIIEQRDNFKIVSTMECPTDLEMFYLDPRHPDMGYRSIVSRSIKLENSDSSESYHCRRIKLGIAEGSQDFIIDKSTILEGHYERINGVDFEKGCYVGQEVTARMKYRGKIKKIMLPVILSGPAPESGTEITNEKHNKIGELRSSCDKNAIALLRADDVVFGQQYGCNGINVTPFEPNWLIGVCNGR